MKIGIFDSGLGGLIIARSIRQALPKYDYVYLGDTKRVPYGNRSHETVYEFTKQAVNYLFKNENCAIIIIACNTSSARSLRRIQQEYLPKYYPDRKVIGVLVPTAEECSKYEKVGIIGTNGTVLSKTFVNEIKKLNKKTKIYQNPAPMLVPLAEEGEKFLAEIFVLKYLKPLLAKKPDAIALGCTHYPYFKREIKALLPKGVKIISQDELIPLKLKDYFERHPEITQKLAKDGKIKILVTDTTKNIAKLTKKWFGNKSNPELVSL